MNQESLFQVIDESEAGILTRPNHKANKLSEADRGIHDWYRFVLSFPPHLVRHYLQEFGIKPSQRVLDPFCGTGTTLVESKKLGIESSGIEINPMAHFASSVKVNWNPDPEGLTHHAEKISSVVSATLKSDGIKDDLWDEGANVRNFLTLPDESQNLLLQNSISPLPLHKVLRLLRRIRDSENQTYVGHELLALAKTLVYSGSNLRFGPEVGVGRLKPNAPILTFWLNEIRTIANDLRQRSHNRDVEAIAIKGDSRDPFDTIQHGSIDAVITSPPYPNEKDYTRITRLESVLLGFMRNKNDLRNLKNSMIRSNTRNVFKSDDDDKWVEGIEEVQQIAEAIEKRRVELEKNSGFERLYHRVVKLYFGGMVRHLSELRKVLRPGACLAYVVGDQASYLRIMIRTGKILAEIAEPLGYEVKKIDLFRTRLATATKEQLREEAVVLRWPG